MLGSKQTHVWVRERGVAQGDLSELEGIATNKSLRFSFVLFFPKDSRSPLPLDETDFVTLRNSDARCCIVGNWWCKDAC